jgi:hypothetical protein
MAARRNDVAPSIDDYEQRRRCWVRGCSEDRETALFCETHWANVPEDLQLRIAWARENGSSTDWRAAIDAAVRALRE